MVIKFACPNGHPLTASEELVGKPGKCPKCQSMFLVPSAPAPQLVGQEGSGLGANSALVTTPGETIAFLCPNGHKLTGPRTLQGKAGQCPHCGSKFRIPSYDEPSPTAATSEFTAVEEDIPVGEMVEHDEAEDLQDVEVEDVEIVEDASVSATDAAPVTSSLPTTSPGGVHPLAELCRRLWRRGECTLEICYAEGETLKADFYSPELSQLQFGVFAYRTENGKYSVTAIPWDSVRRLAVCNLTELPKEAFS